MKQHERRNRDCSYCHPRPRGMWQLVLEGLLCILCGIAAGWLLIALLFLTSR